MNKWESDKKWSDKFIIEIKRILGEHLISEAPLEEDVYHNTDLMVLKLDSIRIACRIRSNYYLNIYPNDITIRSDRPTGIETELTKIINGWGDYFFYGFANETETQIKSWILISLNNFRQWLKECNTTQGIKHYNKDGSSSFKSFDITRVPTQVIFKRS